MKPRKLLYVYLAIIPTFALLATFNYCPILSALVHAFYEWDIGGIERFNGMENFRAMFEDRALIHGFQNLFFILIAALTIKLFVPLFVAVLIYRLPSERPRYLYRVIFVAPMVVPFMVNILLWRYIYSDAGILSELMRAMGLGSIITGWLDNPHTALIAMILVGFPFVHGFNLLIFYAGLSNIPESVIEASLVDGVSAFQRFFKIELPMVMGQVKLLSILTVIWTIQQYDLPLILTHGGPGYETMVPGLWMYLMGFSFNRMGYACAIGFVLFVLMLGITILNMRYLRASVEH